MSLSDLASIGSLVSGFAVITTLVFLLFQMRQTNRNQQSLMQQGRAARWVTILLNRTTPEMTNLNSRLWEGDLSLNGAEIHASIAQDAATFVVYRR